MWASFEDQNNPGSGANNRRNRDGAHECVVEDAFAWQLEGVDERVSYEPHGQPFQKPVQRKLRVSRVLRVRREDHPEIAQTNQYRYERRPAKPVHRARHQHWIDFRPNRRLKLFHCGEANQVEKIEQADPDDSEYEVNPAERDLFGGSALREAEVG